jgi:hypothetical protein
MRLNNLELRAKPREKLVKAKCLSLSTTTAELSTQPIQALPGSCHLMVEVLNCRVKLMKCLTLLNKTKVRRFIMDLATAMKMVAHKV